MLITILSRYFWKNTKNIIHKNIPHINTYLSEKDKYIFFKGRIKANTPICVISFCAGRKTNKFLDLVKLCEQEKLSMTSVFLENGGDCANNKCPGHLCNENCHLHSWSDNIGRRTNIFKNKHTRHLLNDRTDLLWQDNKTILKYRDWGTAKNCCPYCGYKHQVWYKAWKKNIKKWFKSSINGIFVFVDDINDLGEGQAHELRYLKKKGYNFQSIDFKSFEKLLHGLYK